MGNEDKIKRGELVKRASAFLPDEIRDLEGVGDVYSLEKEFAKTKKNRNYKLVLFMVGFIAALAFVTYLYSLYLAHESEQVQVDIQEFEDLRLKEFLQSARKDEGNIDLLRMKMLILRVEMMNAVLDVKNEYLGREMEIGDSKMSMDEKTKSLKNLKDQEQRSIKAVEANYRVLIAKKQGEIWALEETMRKNQQAAAETTKSDFLLNEDKLYKMKMKKLRETQQSGFDTVKQYYDNYMKYITLRYNPVFKSSRLNGILAENKATFGDVAMKDYNPIIGKDAQFSQAQFTKLRESIDSDLQLINRLMSVPYINSVAPALKSIDFLTRSIIYQYEDLWTKLVSALNSKGYQLQGYNYAFKKQIETLQKDNRPESGYILDPRNEKSIVVYVINDKSIKSGDTALVLRGKEEYVGTVEFFRASGIVRARILEKNEDLLPFDKIVRIMLEKKQEQKQEQK